MRGVAVVLFEKTLSGHDALNNPIFTEQQVTVNNVLIGQPTTDDVTSSVDLYGKKVEFMLGLPKGDNHTWTDVRVDFFGQSFHTFGDIIQGIEENVPTPWHKKIRVERYG